MGITMTFDLKTVARALGGQVSSGQVLAPGPGHSANDRSLSVKLDSSAPDGFLVNSFANDDPKECKDYVRGKLGLAANDFQARKPRAANTDIDKAILAVAAAQSQPSEKNIVARYDYCGSDGRLLYQIIRLQPKDFRHRQPNGNGSWIWRGTEQRVLYRLPDLLKYPDGTVFVCEGEKDADRVASLGHCATTVASGEWTDDCIKALTGRDCLILEDNDATGRKKALDAAQALHGVANTIRIVRLPDVVEGEDVSDWLDADRRHAEKLVDVCFDAPLWQPDEKPAAEAKSSNDDKHGQKSEAITLTYFSDLKEATPKLWLVKNVIARGETSGWIGPPGAGKSAALADLCVHGASSPSWRGYRIKQQFGSLYLALERVDLVKRRFVAQRLRDNLPIDLPIAISGQVIDLMNRSCVADILDAIKHAEDHLSYEIVLVTIDTYAKGVAAGGGDESTAKDQGIAVANLRRVLDKVNIHIATAGHTGKDVSRGERGSNAKLADVDLQVQISGETIKTATIVKANDQPLGLLTSFQLEPYDFSPDEDGDPFRTYILAKEVIEVGAISKRTLNPKQQLAMEALAEVTLSHGASVPSGNGLPAGLKSVTADQWRNELLRRKVLDPDVKNPRARYAELRDQLAAKHLIGVRDELVWLATTQEKSK